MLPTHSPRTLRYRRSRTAHAATICTALFSLLFVAGAADAAERELEQEPAPTSAESIETPLERTFLRLPRRQPLFPWITESLDRLPPFFADTHIDARFRTYYMHKDRAVGILSEAWAVGGSLYYESGRLADTFSLEAELFTSQPAYAPEDRGGTLLLQPVQEGYTILGIANGQLHWRDWKLTGFRQYLDLPYLNRNDNRMTPQAFEAITLAKNEGSLRLSTGYVWGIKRRNSDEFVSIAEAVGVNKERGIVYGGLLYQPTKNFHAGTSAGAAPDLYTNVYGESGYTRDLGHDASLRLDVQFTYQKSLGDELVPIAGSFETWNIGFRGSTSWQGALFRLGFSITGDDSAVLAPYGSNPSYVDLMQRTFNQADEKALLLSLSYDFERLGARGLTSIVNFVQGWDGRVLGVRGNASEVDVTVDYRVAAARPLFEGLWLRVRGSWLHDEALDRNGTDFRVILRYDFPII